MSRRASRDGGVREELARPEWAMVEIARVKITEAWQKALASTL